MFYETSRSQSLYSRSNVTRIAVNPRFVGLEMYAVLKNEMREQYEKRNEMYYLSIST